MVVVMAPEATESDIDNVVSIVEAAGGEAFVSRGVNRTIVGLIGDAERFGALNLRGQRGVGEVVRITAPYKLVSREHHAERSVVRVGGVPIGPGTMTLIAGPCAVETPEQTLKAALMAKSAGASLLRGGAFKPRTSPYAFQGLGEDGLKILADVRAETGMPVVTEVVDARDVELVARYADMLQIGTRNTQNFALLQAVGEAGKPVMIKRGMSGTIEEWLMSAEYVAQRGNLDIVLCERGIRTFEKATRNTLDISAVPVAQKLSHLPVIVDPSHSGATATWCCRSPARQWPSAPTASSSTCTRTPRPPCATARRPSSRRTWPSCPSSSASFPRSWDAPSPRSPRGFPPEAVGEVRYGPASEGAGPARRGRKIFIPV